eukprot:jgi/Bigna1/58382/fgenesh1_pm.82_\
MSGKSSFEWATVDPFTMSESSPAKGQNLVKGEWRDAKETLFLKDPLNGDSFLEIPDVQVDEIPDFVAGLTSTPKSGLHNPLRNVERYVMLGEVCERAAQLLGQPEIEEYFTKLIQRVVGKSWGQCKGEVVVVRKWLSSFAGDNVRNLSRSFGLPGDHFGQETRGYRWPFGGVCVITPFNFPLEIPCIQALSALFMGNRPLVKPVAELLTKELRGKVKLEDAGFDWKILGPDVHDIDYVAWQCDQDAYAYSGQKCSAQSILFVHENWKKAGIVEKISEKACARNLEEMTLGPVITWTNDRIKSHIDGLLAIPGAEVVCGGKPLEGHTIPSCYGAFEATAVFVPLAEMMKPENYKLATTELFGPFQVITEYNDSSLDQVLEACERMESHLTPPIVSQDINFQQKGGGGCQPFPGDPRSAGIHTPEAIKLVWSTHREIIYDCGRADASWTAPKAT